MDHTAMIRAGRAALFAGALLLPTLAEGQQHFPAEVDLEVMLHYSLAMAGPPAADLFWWDCLQLREDP